MIPDAQALSAIVPQILARGLAVLRENIVMPFLVNRGYDSEAGERGSVVTIPVPSAMEARDVVASKLSAQPDPQFVAPTTVSIPMDNWKKADFAMTDKDLVEIQEGYLPLQAESAVKALANKVDSDLLGQVQSFYGLAGTLGQPIDALSDVVEARRVLNEQLAPMDPRYLVVGPQGEAEMLGIAAFHDASFGVGGEAILEGRLTRRLGFGIAMDQNVGTFTSGGLDGVTVAAAEAAGETSIGLTVVTTGVDFGDIIKFAGDPQQYVVTSAGTDQSTISIAPALQIALTGGEVVSYATGFTPSTTYEGNMAFHRDAMAFVTRPLSAGADGLGTVVRSISDPESRLTLRLEISRENKQTRWCWDILYGFATIRRELGCRVHGAA